MSAAETVVQSVIMLSLKQSAGLGAVAVYILPCNIARQWKTMDC